MRTKLAILFAVCVWAVQVAAQVPVGQSVSDQAQALFEANAFEELDELTETYISSMARTPNGAPLLYNIYMGIGRGFSGDPEDLAFWQSLDEKTKAYVEARPESSTAIILRAKYYRSLAWAYRGNGFAKDVTREGWRRYRENMALAESVLFHVSDPIKNNPQWYVMALDIRGGMSARSSGFYDLLNQAMTRHPYYDPIYFSAAIFMDKRWSGDPEMVDRFARIAADYTSERFGAGMYVAIYSYLAASYYPRRNLFLYLDPDWALMKQGMQDILENYPVEWNFQKFGLFACMEGDAEFGAEMFAHVNGPPIEEIWEGTLSYEGCSLPNFGMVTIEDITRDIAMQWLFDVLLALGYEPL